MEKNVVELQNVMPVEERMAEPLSHLGLTSLPLATSILPSSKFDLHSISFR
jgi:hypothetical protein